MAGHDWSGPGGAGHDTEGLVAASRGRAGQDVAERCKVMNILRSYQQDAIKAALEALREGKNPLLSLPTGSGKSHLISALTSHTKGRVLVLSHRQELLLQNRDKILSNDVSFYSAGIGEKVPHSRVIIGGIASCYRSMDKLLAYGPFELAIIDEAHLIPESDDSMYRQALSHLNGTPVIGLTATPYRTKSGSLHEGPQAIFNHLAIHIKPSELIPEYLCSLVGQEGEEVINTIGVHVRAGDFVTSELEQIGCDTNLVESACREIIRRQGERTHVLVFAIGVAHAELIQQYLPGSHVILGNTPSDERSQYIEEFKKNGGWLINCNVLTTGFDAPEIDLIALLRPTQSKVLHVQMMGRGMRKAPGKENCLVLDFSGNCQRHGNIDIGLSFQLNEKNARREETIKRLIARKYEARDYQMHKGKPEDVDPMKGDETAEFRVTDIQYVILPSKNRRCSHLVAVYNCRGFKIKQWVCVEMTGGARWHAKQWFARRGYMEEVPKVAVKARQIVRSLPVPKSVNIRQGDRGYWEVSIEHFED